MVRCHIQLWSSGFFPLLSSCLGFPGVALGARAPWPDCGAASATPCWKRRWQRQPRASPGTRFWGQALGGGTQGMGGDNAHLGAVVCLPVEGGSWVPAGWGGTVTTGGTPRRRFCDAVSPRPWRGALGSPLALLQRCRFCAGLVPWTVLAHPRSQPTLSPTTEPLYEDSAARLGSKPASCPPTPP